MQEEQWGLPIERSEAERYRRHLLAQGQLDCHLKVRSEGDRILFPVTSQVEGAIFTTFEVIHGRVELPRHERIGGIAIIQDNDPQGAELLLKERSSVHTVLFAESGVEGEYRTKRFRVLAGEQTTATICTEYGRTFCIDLEKAYFSARLSSERQRIVSVMTGGETVLDLFAGVGPFAIMLAPAAQVIWACDINPGAISLLIKNIALNRVKNVIPVYADGSILPDIFTTRFDRIIMNLPMIAEQFLPVAFRLCRPGGVIHLYALVSEEENIEERIRAFPVSDIRVHHVRSYAPGKDHRVYDITVA
ncbi:MAG TPA: 50S ribosomal protein L11 methyltransferase [Methanospirillum sp.]|nr:50S ribosomal protein L11 methyltransferase [Methanospirillum sp.]